MGMQQSSMSACDRSGSLTPPHQPEGDTRSKRRRRSSSLEQEAHLRYEGHEDEESRGRDARPPPARRRRVVLELDNSWRTLARSSPPAEIIQRRQGSRSPSPLIYYSRAVGPEPDPSGRGIDLDGDPSEDRSWSPPNTSLQTNRGDSGSNDVLMRSDWDSSSAWSASHPVQEQLIGTLWKDAECSRIAEPRFNIATTAGNVFTQTNWGNVSVEPVVTSDFMTNLADRLKICLRAFHTYYPSGEESALHRGQCTPGTRIDILQGITHWAYSPSSRSENVYWLSGQAGAGKTTIA
ncbi:hypothetical protein BKA70DRAFT_1316204 [Coprinopsis sp. MPI-PUGE-AT-0042]|nr:hypothetical protein BKA70DRAFT_1316204 [Coprinopsis sp. MPI-PUGE-AT-0042]